MVTQIVIHILPQEIDWFEGQIKQLKQGSYYLAEDDNIIIDVTLNLNLVEWEKSKIPKQFFIDKFKQIEKLCDWCETQFIIDEENKCLGCNDKRREAIKTTKSDNILYLDGDVIFKPELLKYIIESAKLVEQEYYIISPQTVRMWDESWDVITNQKFIYTPANIKTYYNNDPFKILTYEYLDVSLESINQFKFGGGWFNLLSTKLLKLIDIPDSLGPYGVDDLYVMICCDIMKQKGYNVLQYILKNTIIIENFKYRYDPYKDYIVLTNNPIKYQHQAKLNLNLEIQNFMNKI
jgi:hypothetical protein